MADTARALDECLTALQQGRKLNDILQRYPRQRDELIALLQVSIDVGGLQPPTADARFKLRARNQMLALAAQRRAQRFSLRLVMPRLAARPALRFGAAAAVGFAVMVGAIGAAANSMPGDPLYGLKTTLEKTRIALTLDPQAQVQLRQAYGAHRLDEAGRLAAEGRLQDAIVVVNEAAQEVADTTSARAAWTARAEARVDQVARKSAAVKGQREGAERNSGQPGSDQRGSASRGDSGKTPGGSGQPGH